MHRISPVAAACMIVLAGCTSDRSTSTSGATRPWEVKPDSANIAILVVDAATFAFEGGQLSYFPRCAGCEGDSLPLHFSHSCEIDQGSLQVHYTPSGEPVLSGLIGWGPRGRITWPRSLLPSESFAVLETAVEEPSSPRRFVPAGRPSGDALAAVTASVWGAVSSLDVVHGFTSRGARVGYCLYAPGSGFYLGSRNSKWIVFLYWEGR